MKKTWIRTLYDILVSTHTMAVLFVVFATAMAAATFIENDFGTETARKLVYEAWWFELLMFLGAVNLAGNIIRFRLYRKEKWHSFIFHLAFLFILTGAFITRYFGYEGQMPILEGETSNVILSEKNYLMLRMDDGKIQKNPIYKRMQLSAAGKNRFSLSTDFKGKPVKVELLEFIPHARKVFDPDSNGIRYLELVESAEGKRHTRYLPKGKGVMLNGLYVAYNDTLHGGVQILEDSAGNLRLKTAVPGRFTVMKTGEEGILLRDSLYPFHTGALYEFDNVRFVVPSAPAKGKVYYTRGNAAENPWNVVRLKVKAGNEEKTVDLTGGQYYEGNPAVFRLDSLNFVMFYGPKRIRLPFSLHLRDFQIEYYPGSRSPKSYASEVTVTDKDTSFDYRIHMNHVLDYKGYRFFQASYSLGPGYERTILSVNHDFWGTRITYLGYALLYFGLLMIFFNKHSHFNYLRRRLARVEKLKKELGFVLFLAAGWYGWSQDSAPSAAKTSQDSVPDLKNPLTFVREVEPSIAPDSVAAAFGRLVIQDLDGRMEPVNTYSSALLRKLSKHDTYRLPGTDRKITSDQTMLSMIISPHLWAYAPIIYLERGDEKVREILGLPENQKYARLADFFDKEGNYILMPYVDEASKARIKNKFQKDIQNIDKRVNLLYITLTGRTLRLFPKPGDPNNRWYAPVEIPDADFPEEDGFFATNILKLLGQAVLKKDYAAAMTYIDAIDQYQKKFGAEVYPDENKIRREIFYNKYDAFRTGFWKLMLVSLLLLVLSIAYIISPRKYLLYGIRLTKWIIVLMFLWMLFFLGLRWYISGRAPWSNAYESLIYVALATLAAGIWLGRKSHLTMAAAAFVSSIILMVAHWSWMDPEIANLVPVLNSYWLMIHVSIIVASYGPFILSAFLGFLALWFVIFTTPRNFTRFSLTFEELTYINKMSMIVGLVLLTIGNFLGGQWANESWGRYWGWDPKETWALISIMVYAVVVHEHIIPALRGKFKLNLMSMFAVWSIIMTYFGVNFYLSGLHSYAKGDPVKTPASVYISFAVMVLTAVLAGWKYRKYYRKKLPSKIKSR